MRAKTSKIIENARIKKGVLKSDASYGFNGAFIFTRKGKELFVICSDQGGWDHVSVSLSSRCPSWFEMCYIKDLFFNEQETVIQFHPKKSEYINQHPYTLHIWRKQNQEHELPPGWMVGLTK